MTADARSLTGKSLERSARTTASAESKADHRCPSSSACEAAADLSPHRCAVLCGVEPPLESEGRDNLGSLC